MFKLFSSILSLVGFGAGPTEFQPNIDANVKIIETLREAGSNIEKAHPIEHHFYFHSESCLNALMKKGAAIGYRVANTGTNIHEGIKYWYGDLVKDTVPDLITVNEENVIMLKLAAEFDADYDGWGTSVET